MKSGFQLLKNKVCNNKLSETFFNQVTSPADAETMRRFDRLLAQRIAAYAPSIDDIQPTEKGGRDSRLQVLNQLVERVPTLLFRLVMDWSAAPEQRRSGRNLLLAILSALIWNDSELQPRVKAFVADIDPAADIRQLNARLIQKADGEPPVPKQLFADFLAMMKFPVALVERNDLAEQIENLYCFEALSQFLLTYYFDLLCAAETDTAAGYIHVIFLKLFAALKNREAAYWEAFAEQPDMRQSLLETVGRDEPGSRHPLLRKTAFKSIQLHNPLFIPPGEGASEAFIKRFNQRLAAFLNLPSLHAALLLDTLLLLRGREPVEVVAECFYVEDRPKFDGLRSFLSGEKQQTYQSLDSLLARVAERKPARRTARPTETTAKAVSGKKLTRDQVAAYLKERMLTYHATTKPEGALTRDQIPEYLSALSRHLADSRALQSINQQELDAFVAQVSPDIREMASLGMLSGEEKEAFRNQLCRQAEQFSGRHSGKVDNETASGDSAEPAGKTGGLLEQEIIPIGFERGAPRIAVGVFFRFPFSGMDGSAVDPFTQHMAYLEKAVAQSVFSRETLGEIRSRLAEMPKVVYRKTFDIFPAEGFDESMLLVAYSLWRNNALHNLLLADG